MREALERLTQQNETLHVQLLEAESALLAEQEAVADLKQALAAAECRHATPLKADQAVQVRRGPLVWVWRGLYSRLHLPDSWRKYMMVISLRLRPGGAWE